MGNTLICVLIGTGLSFLGTMIGSSVVLFFKNINSKFEKFCLGFAAGIMTSASIWSLIIPAFNMVENNKKSIIILTLVGLSMGTLFLLLLDRLIPHLHLGKDKPEGMKTKLEKSLLLVLSVTLHNIPEGMAVGVAFAVAGSNGDITLASAFALAIGMMIQNIPEGAAVSLPVKQAGRKKGEAFLLGSLSGIVEPIFGVLTVIFLAQIKKFLPFFLMFAAGSMLYVVVEELIPESQSDDGNSNIGVLSFMLGFILMLILDVCLG